jgi:glycosyltransferase involved in cell wall biosynthesis
VADATTVRGWLRSPWLLLAHLARHPRVRLVIPDAEAFDHRGASLLAARLLSRGVVEVAAPGERPRRISSGEIVHATAAALHAACRAEALVARARRLGRAVGRRAEPPAWRPGGALYLRSDPWYGVRAGGSIAHIAGILNALARRLPGTKIATTDTIPTLAAGIPVLPLPAPVAWRDERTLACLAANASHARGLIPVLSAGPPALIYQRSSAYSLLGAWCARRSGAPLVLEFNGSESWIARHWGNPLKRAALCDELETAALRAADLVVAVSQPMCDGLLARGLEPQRVLCCPNGVDTGTYRADLTGLPLRHRLGWEEAVVIGFIGTCGPWHGVELLAEAFILARAS